MSARPDSDPREVYTENPGAVPGAAAFIEAGYVGLGARNQITLTGGGGANALLLPVTLEP